MFPPIRRISCSSCELFEKRGLFGSNNLLMHYNAPTTAWKQQQDLLKCQATTAQMLEKSIHRDIMSKN